MPPTDYFAVRFLKGGKCHSNRIKICHHHPEERNCETVCWGHYLNDFTDFNIGGQVNAKR